MRTIAIIGGSKCFNARLLKMLKSTDIEWKSFTKYMVKKENYYDYVVVNSGTNIKDILLNSGFCFVNMDLIGSKNNNINVYGNIITYGLGSKNTVTVSSMEDNNSFVYCLQREVNHNALGMLEAEEVPINIEFSNEDEIYATIVGITINLIEGKDINNLIKGKKLSLLK